MMWAKCNVLFREYFHVVQYQLREYYRSSPDWLVEGIAERVWLAPLPSFLAPSGPAHGRWGWFGSLDL